MQIKFKSCEQQERIQHISWCVMCNGAQYCPDNFLEGAVWATSHGMMSALHRNGRQEEAVANSSGCQFHEWPSWGIPGLLGIHTAVHLSLRWNRISISASVCNWILESHLQSSLVNPQVCSGVCAGGCECVPVIRM